jgi:hypothetical protein
MKSHYKHISEDEWRVIKAMRNGARVDVHFFGHGLAETIDDGKAHKLLGEYRPVDSKPIYEIAQDEKTDWYEADNDNFNLTIFLD